MAEGGLQVAEVGGRLQLQLALAAHEPRRDELRAGRIGVEARTERAGQSQLDGLGIKLAIVPNALTRRAVTSMYDLAVQLREDPLCEAEFMESIKGHPCGDMHAFAGFAELCEMEERYLPADELAAKYEGASHGWKAGDTEKAAV